MATLTEVYRRQTLTLRAQTLRDLQRLWPALDWTRLDRTFPAWLTAVSALVARDRVVAAGLASSYLRAFRMASGVPGEALVVLAAPPTREQVETSLRVTTVVAAKRAAAAGRNQDQAQAAAFVLASGAVTRLVLNAGRETVRRSLAADPQGAGWRRVTSARACAFCRMLSGRGSVYAAETADFASHGHCACSAEPVYGDTRNVQAYTPSQRTSTEADRARVREFIRTN